MSDAASILGNNEKVKTGIDAIMAGRKAVKVSKCRQYFRQRQAAWIKQRTVRPDWRPGSNCRDYSRHSKSKAWKGTLQQMAMEAVYKPGKERRLAIEPLGEKG